MATDAAGSLSVPNTDRLVNAIAQEGVTTMRATNRLASEVFGIPRPSVDKREVDEIIRRAERSAAAAEERIDRILRKHARGGFGDPRLAETQEAVRDALRQTVAADFRVKRLVRTETALNVNTAAADAFIEAGLEWVRLSDGPGCHLYTHRDGPIANRLELPADEFRAHPIAHPNCVRRSVPIEKPRPRRARRARRTIA